MFITKAIIETPKIIHDFDFVFKRSPAPKSNVPKVEIEFTGSGMKAQVRTRIGVIVGLKIPKLSIATNIGKKSYWCWYVNINGARIKNANARVLLLLCRAIPRYTKVR